MRGQRVGMAIRALALMITLLLTGACSFPSTSASAYSVPTYVIVTLPPVTTTRVPTYTPVPSETPTPVPTDTPPPTKTPGGGPTPIPPTAVVEYLPPTPTPTPLPTDTPWPSPTPLPWPTPIPPEGAIGPDFIPPDINPLTGLPYHDPLAATRRPIAAKVSNAPPVVRPQSGLDYADLVFEHEAEGYVTRFTAIFLTYAPTRVGSIRSARLIDLELPVMYDALLAFSGASNGVRALLRSSDFSERLFEGVTTGPPIFTRDPSIPMPHNLFLNTVELWTQATAWGIREPTTNLHGMGFNSVPQDGGSPARRVTVRYGATTAQWVYEPGTGRWLRWSDGEPHMDAVTGRQLTASNVVVVAAQHVSTSIVEDMAGGVAHYSLEIQVWGSGPCMIFRDGLRYDGVWSRWNRTDMLSFYTAAGHTIYLKPGNTWFQVVRGMDQVTVE